MSDKSESTYVWQRINRAKLPLILDDDGDWVANPNIEAAAKAGYEYVHGGTRWEDAEPLDRERFIGEAERIVAAALTQGDTARDIAELVVAPGRLPQTRAEVATALTRGDPDE